MAIDLRACFCGENEIVFRPVRHFIRTGALGVLAFLVSRECVKHSLREFLNELEKG